MIFWLFTRDISEIVDEPRHSEMQALLDVNNAMQSSRLYRLDDNGVAGIVPDCDWVGRAKVKQKARSNS